MNPRKNNSLDFSTSLEMTMGVGYAACKAIIRVCGKIRNKVYTRQNQPTAVCPENKPRLQPTAAELKPKASRLSCVDFEVS